MGNNLTKIFDQVKVIRYKLFSICLLNWLHWVVIWSVDYKDDDNIKDNDDDNGDDDDDDM